MTALLALHTIVAVHSCPTALHMHNAQVDACIYSTQASTLGRWRQSQSESMLQAYTLQLKCDLRVIGIAAGSRTSMHNQCWLPIRITIYLVMYCMDV